MAGLTVQLAGNPHPTRYRVSTTFLLQQRNVAAYGHVRTVEHFHQLMNAQHLMLAQLAQHQFTALFRDHRCAAFGGDVLLTSHSGSRMKKSADREGGES